MATRGADLVVRALDKAVLRPEGPVVTTALRRLPLGDRLRMLGRAAVRHLAGPRGGSSRV